MYVNLSHHLKKRDLFQSLVLDFEAYPKKQMRILKFDNYFEL